ncbi:hypothetical protein OS493_038243 [Desmophyllum pertusum]|uniref:Uncharacterized protein n=1 Tax=Desmophyllum pertusum TaxID=174260 RepID=A0A9X0CMT1_9CNID|nr:hypothetical protein OS493_038243 [Desmophyllum pertusum]
MEVNGKPMKEMDVQEVKEFIEQEFESGVAEKFEVQKIDGKTMVMLAKGATKEQYEACGLMTVAEQLKLRTLVNTAVDDNESGCTITAVKPKKPSKAQLKDISEMNSRIYKTKRKAIRAATIKRWPGNDIPNFKKNKVACDELNQLVEELSEDCCFEPLKFGRDGIRQHVLDVLNERRRHRRNGYDYTTPDKRTLKRKTDSTESTESIEDTSGDTDLEGMDETDENDALPEKTAQLIICVAFNAIRVADVQRTQLASSAKALGLKDTKKDKSSLIQTLAQSLLDRGYVKVTGDLGNVSRDNVKKIKPF